MFATLIESRAHAPSRAGGAALSVAFHGTIIAAAIAAGAHAAAARPVRPTIVRVSLAPPRSTPEHSAPRRTARTTLRSASLPSLALRIPAFTPIAIGVPRIDIPQSTPMPISLDGRASSGLRSLIGDAIGGAGTGDAGDGAGPWTGTELQMHILTRATPRYPESLRQAGIDGNVRVRFTVDTTGRIDPRSVDVLESTNDLFTQSVRGALERFRFIPSVVGGQRVAALAEMSFEFVVRR